MNQTQVNVLHDIVKTCPYEELKGYFRDKDYHFCFTDSFRVVKLNPSSEPPLIYAEPPAFKEVFGVDLDRLMDSHLHGGNGQRVYPLKADVLKACKVGVFDFGEGLPLVNAKYLLSMMRLFPDAEIYASFLTPEIKPLRFYSKIGVGYFLPIRRKK